MSPITELLKNRDFRRSNGAHDAVIQVWRKVYQILEVSLPCFNKLFEVDWKGFSAGRQAHRNDALNYSVYDKECYQSIGTFESLFKT